MRYETNIYPRCYTLNASVGPFLPKKNHLSFIINMDWGNNLGYEQHFFHLRLWRSELTNFDYPHLALAPYFSSISYLL